MWPLTNSLSRTVVVKTLPNLILFSFLVIQATSREVHAEDGTSESANAVANPVTINFDTLPTNIYLPPNQYQIASFSSYAGATISTAYDCYYGWGGSCPNGIVATSGSGSSYWPTADLYVNFAIPVNGLSFRVIGSQGGGSNGVIDVYVNNSYYTSTGFSSGQGGPGQTLPPLTINLSSFQHVTAIGIRWVSNNDYWYSSNYPLYYDDFTFTPELSATIINPRVNGGLDQTTQNAMPGASIVLQASTSHSGGTYSWSFTPPGLVAVIDGTHTSSSITIRSTDTGNINARLTYTRNGVSVSPSVNINSVLPTLTSFTAQQGNTVVAAPGTCVSDPFWWFKLGCIPPQGIGIHFTSSVHVPTLISDPAQSGIKYVQAVSSLRKEMQRGLKCITIRSEESNVDSGWQLDGGDPYNPSPSDPAYIPPRFSTGNDLTIHTVDYPGSLLTAFLSSQFVDSIYVDDQFWMYLVYFAGEPGTPIVQRPLGRLRWNWGGLVVFDWNGLGFVHNFRYSNAPPLIRTGEASTSMVPMQGVLSKQDVPCPGGPPLTLNNIDSTRVLVRQYYSDILSRSPDGPGWDGWTSRIAQCVFDPSCYVDKRSDTPLGFFFSGEFINNVSQIDPIMANPPGSPNFNAAEYNRRFIFWCYRSFLRRDPDPASWDAWTNILNSSGNYASIVYGFVYSAEYRDRLFLP